MRVTRLTQASSFSRATYKERASVNENEINEIKQMPRNLHLIKVQKGYQECARIQGILFLETFPSRSIRETTPSNQQRTEEFSKLSDTGKFKIYLTKCLRLKQGSEHEWQKIYKYSIL